MSATGASPLLWLFWCRRSGLCSWRDFADDEAAVAAAPGRDRARRGSGKARRGRTSERYRIEVGRRHGVEPKHIVGAITNEAQINSRDIGAIKIYDDHCMVDLPAAMPQRIFLHLQQVWVCGQQLQLSRAGDGAPSGAPQADRRATTFKPAEKRPFKSTDKRPFKPAEKQPFKPGGKKPAPRKPGPKK